ncbi:MAG: hypothetical protein DCC75_10900, partial [Proteobacteria bacterium]
MAIMSYSRVVGAGLLFSLCLLCPIVAWADSASLAADIRAIIAKKNALSKLPYAANAVTKFKRSYSRPGNLRRKDVSGTAPTLASIPGSDISELFWREGVIDALASGQPNPEACGEFHAGQQDGESGGLGACHLTESVGRAFEDLVSSETSQCYMKNFPTETNLRAGAVVPVSGEFPNGKI